VRWRSKSIGHGIIWLRKPYRLRIACTSSPEVRLLLALRLKHCKAGDRRVEGYVYRLMIERALLWIRSSSSAR
jgi:hypothetical protein